ncbi:squalene/phytoene synthase family protein [Aurantiacibacter flavus]|uniref:Squalene/phytoene synthase family protein n=1 Tax=Aurantiacibacter flavus TaxID=3145232 RepID=A0ABV0CW88_9SPHN
MSVDLLETLPLPQRLALSYAPATARPATLTLLALDTRLAGVVLGGGEPMIAQIKLAWWRDRLREAPAKWPKGEPLLAALHEAVGDGSGLGALVDGWEGLLAEHPGEREWQEFATGRASLWEEVARKLGEEAQGIAGSARTWALADLALGLEPGDERTSIISVAEEAPDHHARLPRVLRPLAVLRALAGRALSDNRKALLDGPGAMLVAMRVGISGL